MAKRDIAGSMAKAIAGRSLPKKEPKTRPETDPAIEKIMLEVTMTVRRNVASILEAEEELELDDPLTYSQLGVMAGYASSIIYQQFRSEPPRNNIGILTMARIGNVLGLTPYELMMPADKFASEVIPEYRRARAARSAAKTPKKKS